MTSKKPTNQKTYDNLAGRTLDAFRRALFCDEGWRIDYVWFRALELETQPASPNRVLSPEERALLFRRLALMHSALDDIAVQIKEHRPDNHQLYLRHFGHLRRALAPDKMISNWTEGKAFLDPASMAGLEFCANDLPKETEITEDELRQIKDEINDLVDRVRSSDVNPRLKRWLLLLLSQMESAISDFWLYGPRAFKDALSRTVGEMAVRLQSWDELKKESPEMAGSLTKILNHAADLAKRAKDKYGDLIEIGAIAMDKLPPLIELAKNIVT